MKSGSIMARTAIIALLLASSGDVDARRHHHQHYTETSAQGLMQVESAAQVELSTMSQSSLMIHLEVQVESAQADAEGDVNDKEAAKKKVTELKETLKRLKDQVI